MRPERIKHIPTGLYYSPVRETHVVVTKPDGNKQGRYIKSNLGKNGKVYLKGATLKWVEEGVSSHIVAKQVLQEAADKGLSIWDSSIRWCNNMPYIPEDWIIEPLLLT